MVSASRLQQQTAACWRLLVLQLLVLVVVVGPVQVSAAGSSKVACDYSNRLCQWNATYAFGATVLGDLAFFHGGLYSNDATVPVNGSHMEVLDLRTMSPYVIQVEYSPLLNSSRYKHHLATWDDQLLAVGGEVDDGNGKSTNIMNVLALDMNTRSWRAIKNFTLKDATASHYQFDAVAAVGDHLLAAVQVFSQKDPRRIYLSMDLKTGIVDGNDDLFKGELMLDWPLVAIMSLTEDGSTPHLVLQAKRQVPPATDPRSIMVWSVITDKGKENGLPVTVSTKLPKQPGGSGGKVLAINVLQVGGRPVLVLLSSTSARFNSSSQLQNVTAVSVFDISLNRDSSNSNVALQLSHILLTPPLGFQLTDVRSVDLPLLGNLAVGQREISLLPYVGRVDSISTIDAANVRIQPAPGGFVVRGSGMADQVCQPGATWQPFVIKATFSPPGPPSVVAVSNYTWCQTRLQQITAAEIINNAQETKSNTKLFRVESAAGINLLLLNYQTVETAGGSLKPINTAVPLMGAFINLNSSRVSNFTITTPPSSTGYNHPTGLASCMTALQGRPTYVETGGSSYNATTGTDVMSKGVYVMDAAVAEQQHSLKAAAGGDAAPARTQSAIACSPEGRLFVFGGLEKAGQEPAPGKVFNTLWKPSNGLVALKLGGSAAAPSISKEFELQLTAAAAAAEGGAQPSPRSGHAMAYLPSSVASELGMQQGGLVMYGGSNITATNMENFVVALNETESAAKLRATGWETATWLFDIGARKWARLETQGAAPPGLMYHSMEAHGHQVVVFGGQSFNASSAQVRLSTMLYVLDFASSPPRWRQAQIRLNNQGAFQFDYPSTGLVMLPEFGAVALKHRSAVNLAPIPQSLEFTGTGAAILSTWGLNTLNTTAGDWLCLAPSQPRLTLQQPLLVAADVIVSGVPPGSSSSSSGSIGSSGGSGRRLMQQQTGRLQLVCDAKQQPGSAVQIRAGGAELSNFVISRCEGTAVDIQVDATGAYTVPALLTNITLTQNTGFMGSAVYIGPSAAATLQGVVMSGNTAPQGVVFAAERAGLSLLNCFVSGNDGSAVVFAGSSLAVVGSNFTNNTATGSFAAPSAAAAAAAAAAAEAGAGTVVARQQNAGGALRLLCFETGPGGYDSVVTVANSSFTGNRGLNGGAVYAGQGSMLRLVGVVFSNNSGVDGGALFADRDACVENMVNSTFTANTAVGRGGAVKMHNPSCGSISWSGGLFGGNTAADGGALYLTEITTRSINGSAVYGNNRATRPSVSRRAGSSSGGAGGAIYLGLWGTQVFLHNSTFTNNSATQLGGAIHALAIDRSSVALHRVNATGNAATLEVPGSSPEQFIAATLRSEGGALHVDGSVAAVNISHCSMAMNLAGRGGAVSMNSESGSLFIHNSTLSDNDAFTAGGAVSVTERKSVSISSSSFTDNTLWWKELAAGGGFYCFLCSSVNISSSHFAGNRAAYGGGAAILQPWQQSVIYNTSFLQNTALPDPLSNLVAASNRRRRGLLALGTDEEGRSVHMHFSGSKAVIPTRVGGQAAAVAILGPIAANVTGDSGYYTGGGGLYVSLSSGVRLEQCAFLSNSAFNGGGFLARTDACKPAANSSSSDSACQLQLSQVSVRNNTASAAGGVLITNIRPEVVALSNCSKGSALNRDTLTCLEAPNSLLQALVAPAGQQQPQQQQPRQSSGRSLLFTPYTNHWWRTSSNSGRDTGCEQVSLISASAHLPRSLLQSPTTTNPSSSSGEMFTPIGSPNAAISGYGDFLLTSAASVRCQNLLRLGGGEEVWQDDDCSVPIRAPPGQPFGRSFVLLDGLGDPIGNGIYDAHMPMSALAEARQGAVPYRIFGNTTQAQNGTARFTGLTVNGKPGDTVNLIFTTQNGLALSRQVILRQCQAGEYTDNSTSAPNELSFSCRPCQSPQFSFYPSAPSCSQCASLPANSWAVCNEAALVPADGFYQSHPRSPVLSRCISSFACRRSDATRRSMATWAYSAANMSTSQMNATVIEPYMQQMCGTGYTGPLCGACEADHGHSGWTCVKCLPRSANSFLYFLVCCFMLVVPVAQMVLHAQGVRRNTQLVAKASKLSWTGHPSMQHKASFGSATGQAYHPVLPALAEGSMQEQQQQPQQQGQEAALNGTGAHSGVVKDVASVEMIDMHQLYVCPSAAVAAGAARPPSPPQAATPTAPPPATAAAAAAADTPFQPGSRIGCDIDFFRVDQGSGVDASPFSEADAIAGAIAVSRAGSGTSVAPMLSDPRLSQASGPHRVAGRSSGLYRSASLFQRLFDTESVDHDDSTWAIGHVSNTTRRHLAHTTSSISRRGPSGTSTTSAGSVIGRSGSPVRMAAPIAASSMDGTAPESPSGSPTAAAAAAGHGGGGGSFALAGPGAPVASRQLVHRRTYKFWHADILAMLVNYMQLLGLLRLVRINWAEQLSKLLVYLDLTSGATTWVSVECSLDPYAVIPRSVARSIIVLLWPLAALVALAIFWALMAFMLRRRPWARRRLFFRRWLVQHVVMCVVILLYFLYTTTTREIISLFSCSQVDDPLRLPNEAYGDLPKSSDNPLYLQALSALRFRSSSWSEGFWTSDTNIRCGAPAHVGLAVGLGIPGVLFFALGLPIALWVYLHRINRQQMLDGQCRLEDPEVELQFGIMYEKYRYSCYYWECVILLEAFSLTLLLVMLQSQNNAALQVLVAIAVIFVEAVLHITFQPYACRMLDTLRRLAVYGLMSTLFMLMLVTLSESQDHDRLLAACMIIVALINLAVIGVHLWACGREVQRWLLWSAGKGPGDKLTWADVMQALPEGFRDRRRFMRTGQALMSKLSGGRWKPRDEQRHGAMPAAAGAAAEGSPARAKTGATRTGAPVESAAPSFSTHLTADGVGRERPREERPARPGVVVVINPTPPPQQPTPMPGWLDSVHPAFAQGGVRQQLGTAGGVGSELCQQL